MTSHAEPQNDKTCAREKLKPWTVGLLVLLAIIIGLIFFEKHSKNKKRVWQKGGIPGGADLMPTPSAANQLNSPTDSYHAAVELVKPAVVGISVANAQPFLQAWGTVGHGRPDSAWLNCSRCGPVIIPDLVHRGPVFCPNCGGQITQVPQLQPQAWQQGPSAFCPQFPSALPQAWGRTPIFCPGFPTAQPQAWGQGPSAFCPGFPTAQPQALGRTPMPGFKGLGSGVIISSKGHILTNSHLVSGANAVTVTMFTPQGQKTFPGRVIAHAADRDLAVVKINPGNMALPVAQIGRSSTVRVGDTILALGNPFGLSQTVTSGIVSAVRGSIVIEGHQLNNLIQTDAPVNQGNSGGPLVNLRGEVIAINTAIYSPIQTHTGLGFAVPISQAKEVFASYMTATNRVRQVALSSPGYPNARAYAVAAQPPPEDSPVWLGINIQIMNDIIAEQLKVPVDRGILINQVYKNSPAAAAGVKRGDVIIRFNGRRVTDETMIRTLLADMKPGDKIVLSILRGRKRLDIKFKTAGGAWQAQQAAQQAALFGPTDLLQGSEVETGLAELVSVGLAAITITPEITFAYSLPSTSTGIIATEVEGLSLQCGMKDGDIIKSINNTPTPDLLSFLKIMRSANLRRGLTFSVIRSGRPVQVMIKERSRLFAKGL